MLCITLTFWTFWWHHQKQQLTLKGDFYNAPNDDHLVESTLKWALSKHTGLWQPCFLSCTGALRAQGWECLSRNTDFLWHLTAGTVRQHNALIWEWSQLQPGDISTKYYEGNSQEPLKTNLSFFIALQCFYRLQEKQLKNNLQILSQEWVTNYIKSILSLPLIKKSKTKWERLKKKTAKAASIEPAVLQSKQDSIRLQFKALKWWAGFCLLLIPSPTLFVTFLRSETEKTKTQYCKTYL